MNDLSSYDALNILQNKLEKKIFDLRINKKAGKYVLIKTGSMMADCENNHFMLAIKCQSKVKGISIGLNYDE